MDERTRRGRPTLFALAAQQLDSGNMVDACVFGLLLTLATNRPNRLSRKPVGCRFNNGLMPAAASSGQGREGLAADCRHVPKHVLESASSMSWCSPVGPTNTVSACVGYGRVRDPKLRLRLFSLLR